MFSLIQILNTFRMFDLKMADTNEYVQKLINNGHVLIMLTIIGHIFVICTE